MDNILKLFKFESENITLFLDVRKEISGVAVKNDHTSSNRKQ